MNKRDFLKELQRGINGLPQADIDERLTFYSEMIDDRMEEGLSEEEAVSAIGSVDKIVDQIIADTPLSKIAKEKIIPKRQLKVWEIVLLVLGSPIWLSLLIACIAVILSIYIVLWSVIISLWAVFGAMIGCSVGCIISGIGLALNGNPLPGIAVISIGIVCSGLSIFLFYGCKAVTNGIISLTKKIAVWIKNCIIKKEEA